MLKFLICAEFSTALSDPKAIFTFKHSKWAHLWIDHTKALVFYPFLCWGKSMPSVTYWVVCCSVMISVDKLMVLVSTGTGRRWVFTMLCIRIAWKVQRGFSKGNAVTASAEKEFKAKLLHLALSERAMENFIALLLFSVWVQYSMQDMFKRMSVEKCLNSMLYKCLDSFPLCNTSFKFCGHVLG